MYEEICGYLTLYNFFDLFSSRFTYNVDNIAGSESSELLKKCILRKEGLFGYDDVDMDRHKSMELLIEEQNTALNKETIQKKFVDLVSRLEKNLYLEEKKNLETKIKQNPNDLELLQKLMELQQK